MSQFYLRAWNITIGGLGTFATDGIRVRFSIKQGTVHSPNNATVRLTNNLRSAAEAFCKNPGSIGQPVTISAGYSGDAGILFKGHVAWPIYGRENPTDTLTTIFCTDGHLATSHATVSKTFPPGSTPKDHLNLAIQSFQKYAVNLGFIGQGVDLSQPVYPRSVTLFGMAKKVVEDIAKSKGATWGIQNLLVNILKPSDSIPGAYDLNSATGMIGMPTLAPEGVYVRSLINSQLIVDGLVHIDQSAIQGYLPQTNPVTGDVLGGYNYNTDSKLIAHIAADGIYRIVKIDVEADSRGQPWYMDMLVLKPGDTTPVSIDYGT
jgi:hypothetical protein